MALPVDRSDDSGPGEPARPNRPPLSAARLARGCILVSPADAVLRPVKTSEIIAKEVVRDIVSRRLRTGDSLPHEAAMLKQYGVSRESLREGLRLLEVQGLITIRRGPGGGPVVGQIDPANLGRIATLFFHVAGATYDELFDAWKVTEAVQVDLAAANPDRERVKEAMAPFLPDPPADRDWRSPEIFLLHTQFHAIVASLVDNGVLELLLQVVGQIVTHHIVVKADPWTMQEQIEADHQRIARAVWSGHARKARSLMEEHVASMARVYREQLGPQVDDYIEWA